jgi:hypothetical protein
LDAFAHQCFQTGLVHGDPHPGNVHVQAVHRPPGVLRRLLGKSAPSPRLVLLDNGSLVHLPESVRVAYCELWCAFALGDARAGQRAAVVLAGKKAGQWLPNVLIPRDWSKVTREERLKMRKESGVEGLGDVSRLLRGAPGPLVDAIASLAVVRHAAAQLGATPVQRLRINCARALQGLPPRGVGGTMDSAWQRGRVRATLVGMAAAERAVVVWSAGARRAAVLLEAWLSVLRAVGTLFQRYAYKA